MSSLNSQEIRNDGGPPIEVSGIVTVIPSGTQDVNVVSSVEIEIKNDTGNPVPVSGTVTALQGSNPWTVDGTVTALPSGTQDVNIVGSIELEVKNDSGSPLPVSGTVTSLQGTSPWVVSGTVDIGTIPEVEIKNDVGNPIPISATSLPLPTGASTEAKQTQPGVDIGDVTINNAAGGAAVNIQDGGNSITVDAVTLPVATGENTVAQLYSTTFSKTAIGTTELMTLLLKNPNASGKIMYLKSAIISNSHTVAASWVRFRMYANPTISANGTANTINPLGIGSGNTSVGTAFSTPTITSNGSQLSDTTIIAGNSLIFNFPEGSKLLANNNLLITTVADAAARVGQITLIWTEL